MNKISQNQLWEKLQKFSPDDPTALYPFSQKLAEQQHWSHAFTQRAIEEYKRFLYLCVTVPGGAAPSPIVDEVWHLHLTYTQSYWNELCSQILEKQLHHIPSKGGNQASEFHRNWYQQTLENYSSTFGEAPPTDIWPSIPYWQEHLTTTSIYPKKRYQQTTILFIAGIALYCWIVNPYQHNGKFFLIEYAIAAIAGLGLLSYLQTEKAKHLVRLIDIYFPKKYNTFQLTAFLFGSHKTYQAALVDLIDRGIIRTDGKDYVFIRHHLVTEAEVNPILEKMQSSIQLYDNFSYQQGFQWLDRSITNHPALQEIQHWFKVPDWEKFCLPIILLLIGIIRIIQGNINGKPVGFLIAAIALMIIFSIVLIFANSNQKIIATATHQIWQQRAPQNPPTLENFGINGNVALAGLAAFYLLSTAFSDADKVHRQSSADSWTSSADGGGCGGASSGSGCGGGCGGCGG